jgi:hypothetical protein
MAEPFRERKNPGRGGKPIDIFEYREKVLPSVGGALAVGVVAPLSDEVAISVSIVTAGNSRVLCTPFGLSDVSTSVGGGECARCGVARPEETGESGTRGLLDK